MDGRRITRVEPFWENAAILGKRRYSGVNAPNAANLLAKRR